MSGMQIPLSPPRTYPTHRDGGAEREARKRALSARSANQAVGDRASRKVRSICCRARRSCPNVRRPPAPCGGTTDRRAQPRRPARMPAWSITCT